MKKNIMAIALTGLILISTACQRQVLAGVESSANEMGDIQRVKVTADQGTVRDGCSIDSPELQSFDQNNTLDVINKVDNWYAVKLSDNNIGFINQEDCTPIIVDNNQPAQNTPAGNSNGQNAPEGTSSGNGQAENATETPDTKTDSPSLTAAEQEMLNLVNAARRQNNVPELKIDMEVANVARIKSQDMIDNNYFSHNSPKYGDPFKMLQAFSISYVEAGENIAGNQDVNSAHNALMNSPGHRQNILNPNYTHIGIGIKSGGPYGNMYTQMFVSKPN